MKRSALLSVVCVVWWSGISRADDLDSLRQRVAQLEGEVKELRTRIDNLGPTQAHREIKVAEPVFIGAQRKGPSPLAMDDPSINCPLRSFVTAIQILKTGNTVTQVRYACRGIE